MQLPAMTSNYNSYQSKGSVFDIQGLSVHDGPGCRTLIFLGGCTLNCFWCSNPEGINVKPSLMYAEAKCIACGNCVGKCSQHALSLNEEGKLNIVREICRGCDSPDCLTECYTDALRLSGYEISVEKLYEIIRRDRQFWGRDGGITLTGGEPLLQPDFALEILRRCHEDYIHTAIETCGNVPWKNLQEVLPFLDWIFFDLKHMDYGRHHYATNSGNSLILENARRLSKSFEGRLIFRLPLIPDFNDSEENLNSVISFLNEIGRNEINILPLHHLGREKYQLLQRDYLGSPYLIPSNEKLRTIRELFRGSGVDCFIGSETPF